MNIFTLLGIALFVHLICATIWVGGHIILSTLILPNVLKYKSPAMLLDFEEKFEKIGMPALIIQVITGFFLAHTIAPDIGSWFDFANENTTPIRLKLIFLVLTVLFAIDARFRVIPKLSEKNLNDMALHIIAVTIFSIGFVFAGFLMHY